MKLPSPPIPPKSFENSLDPIVNIRSFIQLIDDQHLEKTCTFNSALCERGEIEARDACACTRCMRAQINERMLNMGSKLFSNDLGVWATSHRRGSIRDISELIYYYILWRPLKYIEGHLQHVNAIILGEFS